MNSKNRLMNSKKNLNTNHLYCIRIESDYYKEDLIYSTDLDLIQEYYMDIWFDKAYTLWLDMCCRVEEDEVCPNPYLTPAEFWKEYEQPYLYQNITIEDLTNKWVS